MKFKKVMHLVACSMLPLICQYIWLKGCQHGVDTVEAALKYHDSELYEKVNRIFTKSDIVEET